MLFSFITNNLKWDILENIPLAFPISLKPSPRLGPMSAIMLQHDSRKVLGS